MTTFGGLATQRSRGPQLLLTGATGLLGRALLPALGDYPTVCLTHRRTVPMRDVETAQGDVSKPGLGFDPATARDLAGRVKWVVHTAAATGFGQSEERIWRTNVQGTRNVIEFAGDAKAILIHMSTAFVGTRSASSRPPTAYELSKRESERLVRESGVPHVILRPSIIVGDSITGRSSCFQGFHHVIDLFYRSLLPIFPSNGNSYLDFVPQDLVARVVSGLLAHDIDHGEYWITAGPRAMRSARLFEVLSDLAPEVVGRAVRAPRLISDEMFERLIVPAFLPSFPGRFRRLLRQVMVLLRYVNLEEPFPSSLPNLERDWREPLEPDSDCCLAQTVRFFARASGGALAPHGLGEAV